MLRARVCVPGRFWTFVVLAVAAGPAAGRDLEIEDVVAFRLERRQKPV
jgi:hypothetical protein